MSEKLILCPSCQSSAVVFLRHDSDWGSGNCSSPVNPEKCYANIEDDPDDYNRDMGLYACMKCNSQWL